MADDPDAAERVHPDVLTSTASDVTWSHVDDGFYVGSAIGEFVGYIDRQKSGLFVASDLHARPLGSFDELSAAMAAVEAAHATATASRPSVALDSRGSAT